MNTIELQQDGKLYQAEFTVVDNLITVYGNEGFEQTQVDGVTEEQAARILLRNLIRKGLIHPIEPA